MDGLLVTPLVAGHARLLVTPSCWSCPWLLVCATAGGTCELRPGVCGSRRNVSGDGGSGGCMVVWMHSRRVVVVIAVRVAVVVSVVIATLHQGATHKLCLLSYIHSTMHPTDPPSMHPNDPPSHGYWSGGMRGAVKYEY